MTFADALRSPGAISRRAVIVIAALSITIVRLPFFAEHKGILDPLIIGLLVLCVGWGAARQPRGSFTNRRALVVFLYAVVVAVALFRGADLGVYGTLESAVNQSVTYILFVAFGIILTTTARNRRELNERLLAIALAPAIYVATNALMKVGGLHSPIPSGLNTGTSAELLHSLGVSSTRTKFPMATSINLFSIVAAATLASMVLIRLRAPWLISRKSAWFFIGACVYCLLLGDSRAALIIALIVVVVLALSARLRASHVAGLIPLLPFIILAGTDLISGTGLAHSLSRGAGQFADAATATGRVFIWEGSWEVLQHISAQQLFGWGAAGHLTSGASAHYAFVFPGDAAAETIFTHNLDLQMIFDTGYAGLAIYILAVGMAWHRLRGHLLFSPRSSAFAFLPILLVIIISGATEVSPTYYSQEALLTTLLIMGAVTALPIATATADRVEREPDSTGLAQEACARRAEQPSK